MTQWARHTTSKRDTAHLFTVRKLGPGRVQALARCGVVKITKPEQIVPSETSQCVNCASLLAQEGAE